MYENFESFPGNIDLYCDMMKRRIEAVTKKWKDRQRANISERERPDTRVYALLQMGPIGVDTEDIVTRRILTAPALDGGAVGVEQRMDLASGYFNLTSVYSDLILKQSSLNYRILMASPRVSFRFF